MEIASHHQRHRAAQWRVSSKSEDARLVADCPSRRALTVRSNYQWSDPYATDRRLARPQASFSVKSRLRGDSQALVDLRSFVISQLWKKFFRHGYRRNQFPPQLGSRPTGTLSVNLGSVTNAVQPRITINVLVTQDAPVGNNSLVNTAHVVANTQDLNTSNNSGTVTTTVSKK